MDSSMTQLSALYELDCCLSLHITKTFHTTQRVIVSKKNVKGIVEAKLFVKHF